MVKWPGVIKHSNDPELIYVQDQSAWEGDVELHSIEYEESDRLIDSSGCLFMLTDKDNGFVCPKPNGESMALRDILGLVKAHAAQKGSCCVAKLYAPTIAEAFKIIASLEEA